MEDVMKKIKATISYGTEAQRPEGFDPHGHGWTVAVKYGRRKFTTPFFTGSLRGDPAASEVLQCLQSDTYNLDDGFVNWAEDYGFDPDSRKAEATYKQCVKQRDGLRRLFGDDFDEFIALDEHDFDELCVEVD
jgi:hypothetical protein